MPHIRLYLDTAKVDAWQRWLPTGLFYGVTCNPLLLERAEVPCELAILAKMAHQAFELGAQEVHLQAWGESASALEKRGMQLAAIGDRVVVKLPATKAGTTAASALIAQGIPVTITAVYAVQQALIAASIGASYVAPYLGRMNDLGRDGRSQVAQMQQLLSAVQSQTRVLTASIREIEDITLLAALGVDTFTFSEAIARAFFEVPETIEATADFERAAMSKA